MSQDEIIKMRIRSMMYRYQSKLQDADLSNKDQIELLNEFISDLIELSNMLRPSKSL